MSNEEINNKSNFEKMLRAVNKVYWETMYQKELERDGLWLEGDEVYNNFLEALNKKDFKQLSTQTRLLFERTKYGYWKFPKQSDPFFKTENYKLMIQIYNIERLRCWTKESIEITEYWENEKCESYGNELFTSKVRNIENFTDSSNTIFTKLKELTLEGTLLEGLCEKLVDFKKWMKLLLETKVISIQIFNLMLDPQKDVVTDHYDVINKYWDGPDFS